MTRTRSRDLRIILILGALSTVSPFSIDMYLPAFPQIAHDLGTTPAEISLSVSGYFIGLALGQLFYGPLLDRFGRKLPLYAGLVLFIIASLGCLAARSPKFFIAMRLLQALGGCAAQVGSIAMVRDFFPVEESAKIISLLILVLSVSPLFAPTVGGFVTTTVGWPWIFAILARVRALRDGANRAFAPKATSPIRRFRSSPARCSGDFLNVIAEPRFYTYAFGGAFSFAGLFVYVTGSPIIFIDAFHVDPRSYGLIFAGLAAGFIGGSQFNIWLSRRYQDDAIFRIASSARTLVMIVTSRHRARLVRPRGQHRSLAAVSAVLRHVLPQCGGDRALAVQQECRQRIGACSASSRWASARSPRPASGCLHATSEPADLRGDGGDGRDRARHSARQSKARRPSRSRGDDRRRLRYALILTLPPVPVRDIGERLHVLLRAVDQIRDRGAVIGVHAFEARAASCNLRQPGLTAHDRGGKTCDGLMTAILCLRI